MKEAVITMNTQTTSANTEVTDTAEPTNNQADRTYTQQEVNDMMAKMKTSVAKKVLKPYEELGDPDEIRNIVSTHQKTQQEQALKRGEFDKILQELASKKDQEIFKRDSVIREFKVDTPLVSAAARHRSVNPDQVKALLKSSVRLNTDGEVEVLDTKGAVRYNDRGTLLAVDDLVQEFLLSNPHFVQSTPATTTTNSSYQGNVNNKIDISKLDMRNPAHRKLYKEARSQGQK
jgi:hypothetical protein